MNDSAPPAGESPAGPVADAAYGDSAPARDYLVRENGRAYAGRHVLVDVWGMSGFADARSLERLLKAAAEAAGARVLHAHVHEFGGGGLSGVAVLAESHISVHTWPEIGYAAFDVFMCGRCSPRDAVAHLERELGAERFESREIARGLRK